MIQLPPTPTKYQLVFKLDARAFVDHIFPKYREQFSISSRIERNGELYRVIRYSVNYVVIHIINKALFLQIMKMEKIEYSDVTESFQ